MRHVITAVRAHPIAVYLTVTFAVTWGAWVPLALAEHGVTVGYAPRYLLGLLGPMIGALIATAIVDGRQGLRDLAARMVRARAGLAAWAAAMILPLGALAAALFVLAAAGRPLPAPGDFGRFNGLPQVGPLGVWLLLVLVNGYGEETGWRGFLLPWLCRRRSPLRASLILAVVWAAWHIPAFWVTETYRLMDPRMIPGFFLGILSGAIFLTWLYLRGRASVLVVAVWHGTFNLTSGTVGARGTIGAFASAVVMAAAALLVILELRAGRRERRGLPAHRWMAGG